MGGNNMEKLNIYDIGKHNLLWSGVVKNVYDGSFYFSEMPTLSAKQCKEILDIISPDYKLHETMLVFEWVSSGYTGTQKLHRQGTILNF